MKQITLMCLMLCVMGIASLTSAATLTVQKNAPVGFGPFAITVTCTDSSVFNFSLSAGQSSTFIFPDATPIDCSVSESMTIDQAIIFDSVIGDTVGSDDGQISAGDAALVDGQTFTVTNTLKGGSKVSSIWGNSTISSIPETTDSSENTQNQSSMSTTGPSVSVGLDDPYTCGEGFIGQVSSDDIANTFVTIDLRQQGKSVKMFTPSLNIQGFYNQSLNYTDMGSPTYIAAGTYAVIVTATYKGLQDTVTFDTDITNQCDTPSFLDILKERNAYVTPNPTTNDNAGAVKKPAAPKKLPNTGAEVL